jgi:hypothetical protein
MAIDFLIDVKDGYPGIDPTTFAPTINHKFVRFDHNSFKLKLNKPIEEWLSQSLKDRWSFVYNDKDCYIHFDNDADYTLFRLHWL